jgi:hypothetical protein
VWNGQEEDGLTLELELVPADLQAIPIRPLWRRYARVVLTVVRAHTHGSLFPLVKMCSSWRTFTWCCRGAERRRE